MSELDEPDNTVPYAGGQTVSTSPQPLLRTWWVRLGIGILFLPILLGWEGAWALWIMASPVIAFQYALRSNAHLRAAMAVRRINSKRRKDELPTLVYTFPPDANGNILPSHDLRQSVIIAAVVSTVAVPLTMTFIGYNIFNPFHTWRDGPPLGIMIIGAFTIVAGAGFTTICITPVIARHPKWEGPERMQRSFVKGQWVYEQRGTPSTPQVVHKGPEPIQAADTVYTRTFNAATGEYEYHQVFTGNPNVKPPAPAPVSDEGEHGTAKPLTEDQLRKAGII